MSDATDLALSAARPRELCPAMRRGLMLRCPACGKGQLFQHYLKVADRCPACGAEMHHHRADDAPPYFTIMVVGHVILGGVLYLERAVAPPTWLHLLIWMPLTIVASLWMLPRVKGALVGLQWALRIHGFGPAPATVGFATAIGAGASNGPKHD